MSNVSHYIMPVTEKPTNRLWNPVWNHCVGTQWGLFKDTMKGFLLLTEREEADAFLFVAREYGGGVLGVVVVAFGGGPLPRSYSMRFI